MIESFPSEADHAVRLKRARMRAWRRGMREMDLILGGFIDNHGASLGDSEFDAFELLMAQKDQDLYDWISERKPFDKSALTDAEAALLVEIRANWRIVEENSL